MGHKVHSLKISKITTECLLTITSNYYFNLTWGVKMIILSHSWYMSPVTAWSRLCSLPFRRSETENTLPKRNKHQLRISELQWSKQTCWTVFHVSTVTGRLEQHAVALLESGCRWGSVWSRQTAVVRLSLKTVTCFCRSMLLGQLTVAASGRVVVLPVLISHLHGKEKQTEGTGKYVPFIILIEVTNFSYILIITANLSTFLLLNKGSSWPNICVSLFTLSKTAHCIPLQQNWTRLCMLYLPRTQYALSFFKCHATIMLSLQRPCLTMHNLFWKLYHLLNIMLMY